MHFPENLRCEQGHLKCCVTSHPVKYDICVKNYKYGEGVKLLDYVSEFSGSDIPYFT
jgi:hypothetical protein